MFVLFLVIVLLIVWCAGDLFTLLVWAISFVLYVVVFGFIWLLCLVCDFVFVCVRVFVLFCLCFGFCV